MIHAENLVNFHLLNVMKHRPYSIVLLFQQFDQDNDFPNKTSSVLQSTIWGSVFHENGQLMDSFYASLIDKYSSLVIPGLDYLAGRLLFSTVMIVTGVKIFRIRVIK